MYLTALVLVSKEPEIKSSISFREFQIRKGIGELPVASGLSWASMPDPWVFLHVIYPVLINVFPYTLNDSNICTGIS